jgi:hypothetical protein
LGLPNEGSGLLSTYWHIWNHLKALIGNMTQRERYPISTPREISPFQVNHSPILPIFCILLVFY